MTLLTLLILLILLILLLVSIANFRPQQRLRPIATMLRLSRMRTLPAFIIAAFISLLVPAWGRVQAPAGGTTQSVCAPTSAGCNLGICTSSAKLKTTSDGQGGEMPEFLRVENNAWKSVGNGVWCLYLYKQTFQVWEYTLCGSTKTIKVYEEVSTTWTAVSPPVCSDQQALIPTSGGGGYWYIPAVNNPLIPPTGPLPPFNPLPLEDSGGTNCHAQSFGLGPGGVNAPPGGKGGWLDDPGPLIHGGACFSECSGAVPPDCPEGSILVLINEDGAAEHSAQKKPGGYADKPGMHPARSGLSADDVAAPYGPGMTWNPDSGRWENPENPGDFLEPKCFCDLCS